MNIKRMLLLGCIAFIIRVILIVYSVIQDKIMNLKYTDIDYSVFSRAGATLTKPQSLLNLYTVNPTYRYPPIIAYLFKLEHISSYTFGICKLLFSLCDILTVIALVKISLLIKVNNSKAILYLWLFNPLIIGISTRGNFDSLLCLILAWSLYFIFQESNKICALIMSGSLYGLAIYLRIFPLLLAPSYYLALCYSSSTLIQNTNKNYFSKYYSILNIHMSHLIFALATLITLGTFVGLSYLAFGWPYLHASLFYHFTRTDSRHNFSPHFYPIYLHNSNTWQIPAIPLSTLTFLPILVLAILIPIFMIAPTLASQPKGTKLDKRAKMIMLTSRSMFCTTLLFISFNKVFTSQYFTWPLVYAPLALANQFIPSSASRPNKVPLLLGCLNLNHLLVLWCAAKGLWLLLAYLLEFQGINTFLHLWMSGLLFFACNVALICFTLQSSN